VIAKLKGVAVRRGLKEAWSKGASGWTSRIRRFGGFSYEEPNSDVIPGEPK
jgi:hypothetical protein